MAGQTAVGAALQRAQELDLRRQGQIDRQREIITRLADKVEKAKALVNDPFWVAELGDSDFLRLLREALENE